MLNNIKVCIFVSFVLVGGLNANQVFDLNESDYKKYKENPEKMLKTFKEKFLSIKADKKDIEEKKLVVKKKKKVIENQKIVKKPIQNLKMRKAFLNQKKIVLNKNTNVSKEKLKHNDKKKTVNIDKNMEKILDKSKKAHIVVKNPSVKNKNNEKTIVRKSLLKQNLNVVETIKTTKINKKIRKYNSIEVNKKLNYTKIIKNKNISNLISNLLRGLNQKKVAYDKDEITSVIKDIHNRKISSVEAQIYLEQIKNLLKGY